MTTAKPRALILTGQGINCPNETEEAFRRVGARPKQVHLNLLKSGDERLKDYQILVLPGGFSYADDISAGKVMAIEFQHYLGDDLQQFREDGKLVIGICNGFQILIKMGLVPAIGEDYTKQTATLWRNDSGRFEDRWVYMGVDPDSPCVFTEGIEKLYLPVRHGEGKLIVAKKTMSELRKNNQDVLHYTGPNGERNPPYPQNPNGSSYAIAGLCDPTGRIFGLMPHPEAFQIKHHHPRWTREKVDMKQSGRQIFKNAVEYFK